jgi:hypothetical protein
MAMPQPPPYSNLQAQPSYNPYSASYNELHMYPQYDNNQPDYVSTYLNNYNRQRQEKVAAEDSPASRSSSIMSSHKTYRNSDSSATLVDIRLDRNSNLFVNTQNVKPTTTPVMAASTMDQSISSSPLSTPSAITPIAFVSQAYASVSVLSRAFARRVQGLEHVRELFCANEYPESFTGQEAVVK